MSTQARILTAAVLLSSWMALTPALASGQEVEWRTDYNAARREAAAKGRPLVIDFGTENCFWCKQLDLRTFRDSAVVNVMNEQFVPLKIDAQRNADLADRLRIQTYPTIVIASSDGRILDTVEGFKEAGAFHEILQRALGSAATSDPTERQYQEAAKAVAAADYTRAVALLRKVIEARKDRPVAVKARQLLSEVEQQAAVRLGLARQQAEQGHTADAVETLKELGRAYAGTQAAAEAANMLMVMAQRPDPGTDPRARRARELFAQARDDFRAGQFVCCLERCEFLAAQFSDLAEGVEAQQLAAQIKNNPEWMKQVCDTLSDRLSVHYLSLAETFLKNGQPHQAVIYLERVVQTFPGTRQAEAAQLRLLQIQGQPTRPVDYKIP
jgi:thioredoxin-like negative regulator of GroEL